MNQEEIRKKILELLQKEPYPVRELAQKIGVSNSELELHELEGSIIEYGDSNGKWHLKAKKE